MILFFDTSALIKFFHEEDGTEVVSGLIHNEENEIWISEATGVEFLKENGGGAFKSSNCWEIYGSDQGQTRI